MKKLIVGALLLCSTALFALSAEQEYDARFGALLVWATNLNASALNWNADCASDQTKEGCAEWHAVLTEQFVMFIEAAKSYKNEEGGDCAVNLRGRIVKHEVRVAAWNVNCVNKPSNEACTTETTALATEVDVLQKELAKCAATEKL